MLGFQPSAGKPKSNVRAKHFGESRLPHPRPLQSVSPEFRSRHLQQQSQEMIVCH